MNIAGPVDHYTDSEDEDVCVIGSPKPPTPPKSYKGGHLTIDICSANADDDAKTESGDESKRSFMSKVVSEACLLFRLIRIC